MGITPKSVESIDAKLLASVLSEVADITSETLELPEIFERVATPLRRLIPFHNLSAVEIVASDRALLHAPSNPPENLDEAHFDMPLTAWSPRWRPRPERYRIEDARAELDPTFSMDAEALRAGLGSGIWEPFRRGKRLVGGLWLCARALQTRSTTSTRSF